MTIEPRDRNLEQFAQTRAAIDRLVEANNQALARDKQQKQERDDSQRKWMQAATNAANAAAASLGRHREN